MNKSKDEEKQIGTDAKVKISPSAFIRQVSVAGSNANVQQPMDAPMQAESEEKVEEPQPPKRKKSQISSLDYEASFLTKNELRNRQGLYIDKENYESLQSLVRSVRTERLSVSGFGG